MDKVQLRYVFFAGCLAFVYKMVWIKRLRQGLWTTMQDIRCSANAPMLFGAFIVIGVWSIVAVVWQQSTWLALLLPLLVSLTLNLRLRSLVRIDHKTGLLNSFCFDRRFKQAFYRARASNKAVSMILLDLDLLKVVNDQFGHSAGDAALEHLGTIIREHVRERHWAARVGGDEFAVVLPGMTVGDAHIAAAQLCRAIAASEIYFPTAAEIIGITASIGVAEASKRHVQPNDWFHAADVALNKAKQLGRNCVVIATPDYMLQGIPSVKPLDRLQRGVLCDELVAHTDVCWHWLLKPHPRY
jgi:diguanylate cyclase (GGDEF)-like protein